MIELSDGRMALINEYHEYGRKKMLLTMKYDMLLLKLKRAIDKGALDNVIDDLTIKMERVVETSVEYTKEMDIIQHKLKYVS